MKRLGKIVSIDTLPIEILLVYASMAFGLKLLSPENTFVSSVSFSVMAVIAPEWVWGLAMLITGSIRLFALVRCLLRIRWAISFVSLIMWTSISISFFLSNPSGTGSITFFTFVLASAWCLLALSKDTYHAGATRK